jgi:hypothetical protein
LGQSAKPEAAIASPAADLIVLDTLGKLADYGYGVGAIVSPAGAFAAALPVLTLERGHRHGAAAVPGLRRPAHAVQHHRAVEGRLRCGVIPVTDSGAQ